eukprot:3974859-Amphidinium_carterae.1
MGWAAPRTHRYALRGEGLVAKPTRVACRAKSVVFLLIAQHLAVVSCARDPVVVLVDFAFGPKLRKASRLGSSC